MKIGVERRPQRRATTSRSASAANTAATRSVMFCHEIGLDYVCAARRVPIARLAAAQAAVESM